ncbi:MAG: M13 family peptidase, partial [Proteobacteria bacterium]|nr:M13 family peptidase [Pseudomonadota bacterium]
DFYQYAVGGYTKSHPIPADRASWGVDGELTQRVQNTLRDILDTLPDNAPAGSNEQKLGDLYRSGMDQARIDAAGLTPLQPLFDRISAITDMSDVQAEVARLHAAGFSAMFGFGATPDARNPQQIIGEADQGGLSMPNREYYLSSDPEKKRVRDAYIDHVAKMFALAGDDALQSRAHAVEVLALETQLAEGCLTPEQMRDPQALYNPMDRAQLSQLTPHIDWNRYFNGVGRPDIESVNVGMPSFFATLDKTVATSTPGQWKTYLRWQVLRQMAPYLPSDIEKEGFRFTGTVLTGVTEQAPRWKRVVATTDELMGDALGQKFVERSFTPQAKARMLEMVENIKAAVREKIATGWMSDASKQGALAKVDSLKAKIGYPDVWQSYDALDIHTDAYASNVMRANAFAAANSLATIGKPKDPNKWEMTPSTVNAYYMPPNNEIVFPAAILQPPYFDVNADDAANYGATGATIGHELTHAFDDEGSQFDATGALKTWMTLEDQAKFQQRAEGVAKQFDEFSYDGQKCNGHLVEGESIADLGGLEIAWAAFQKAQAGKPEPKTDDGFTPAQRFFLNYALSWATNIRPEKAHLLLSNDPHPLPYFRVIGPLANLPEFHEAFGVKPSDAMMRPENVRNKLWNA